MDRPILACITAQPSCENVINTAKLMAERLETELIVVTAQPLKADAEERSQAVKELKRLSEICDVDIVVRYGDNTAQSIAAHAAKCNPLHIFIGEDNGFLSKFLSLYREAPVSTVQKEIVFTVPSEMQNIK